MSITPTMPDERGVRWCLAETCKHARSVHHLNPDARNECRACGHADPKACIPWLWAVMFTASRMNDQRSAAYFHDLQTLEDIEDPCRELEVLNE